MTTAVIGATGRVGSEVVRGLLARGEAVVALVRNADKASRMFGVPDLLHVRTTRLNDEREVRISLQGARQVFLAMGSIGTEGSLQRLTLGTAAKIDSIAQVTRLSVLNASSESLGINQRAHDSIDQFAASNEVAYSTIRPAIFSASLLSAAPEIRATRTWTGLADNGRMALIDYRDVAEVALHVLGDRTLWNAHHAVTGPACLSWPEALELLSKELGETVTFQIVTERQYVDHLVAAGTSVGAAELLMTREWATLAGENDYKTETFERVTGQSPRSVTDFLHAHRADFV